MTNKIVIGCEEMRSVGIQAPCCKHCHQMYADGRGGLLPKVPHSRGGKLNTLQTSRALALFCCSFATKELPRETWAKAGLLARKLRRTMPPDTYWRKIDPVFLEIYGPY